MFNLMFLGLFTVLVFIVGAGVIVRSFSNMLISSWMTSGMTFWKWLVGMIINAVVLLSIRHWVVTWNEKFDATPDAIYFNGENFEEIKAGKKNDLYSVPSLKRGRFHVHEFWLSLQLKGRIDPYRLAEMIDSHQAWLDLEETMEILSNIMNWEKVLSTLEA